MHGFKFFARAHIHQEHRSIAFDQFSEIGRFDKNLRILLVAVFDVIDHFLHFQTSIAREDLRERFLWLKCATAAAANVILPEQGALSTRECFAHFAHGRLGTYDNRGRAHVAKNFWISASTSVNRSTSSVVL